MTDQSTLQAKGFFATLFDFSFTSFVTLRFLKVIYIVLVVFSLLSGLFVIGAFARGGGVGGFIVGLILAPILVLFYLLVARIYIEIIALFFRIGENTTIMARAAVGGGSQVAVPAFPAAPQFPATQEVPRASPPPAAPPTQPPSQPPSQPPTEPPAAPPAPPQP